MLLQSTPHPHAYLVGIAWNVECDLVINDKYFGVCRLLACSRTARSHNRNYNYARLTRLAARRAAAALVTIGEPVPRRHRQRRYLCCAVVAVAVAVAVVLGLV